jgi:uncharacterized protein YlxP (DUF503 family)
VFIATAKITLHLPENHSLKGKRQAIKPIIDRVKNHFNVAIAEVGEQDRWQVAEIGVCCVSGDGRHATEMLSKVIAFVESSRFDTEVADFETEIIPVF